MVQSQKAYYGLKEICHLVCPCLGCKNYNSKFCQHYWRVGKYLSGTQTVCETNDCHINNPDSKFVFCEYRRDK